MVLSREDLAAQTGIVAHGALIIQHYDGVNSSNEKPNSHDGKRSDVIITHLPFPIPEPNLEKVEDYSSNLFAI
jgi:hypothetical protein